MANKYESVTDYNFDQLGDLLSDPEKLDRVGAQIPKGAHIFHGAEDEPEMTEANLKLASRILLGMTLGYITDAALVLLLKRKDGDLVVLDLKEYLQKEQAQAFIKQFEERGQAKMKAGVQMALAA